MYQLWFTNGKEKKKKEILLIEDFKQSLPFSLSLSLSLCLSAVGVWSWLSERINFDLLTEKEKKIF